MARAVLIYDGDCPRCRASALWLMRRALAVDALDILPYDSGPRRARFPALAERACARAMHLALPDGRVVTGAAAVPELLGRLRGWRRVAPMLGAGDSSAVRCFYDWMTQRLGLRCDADRI